MKSTPRHPTPHDKPKKTNKRVPFEWKVLKTHNPDLYYASHPAYRGLNSFEIELISDRNPTGSQYVQALIDEVDRRLDALDGKLWCERDEELKSA